MKRTTHIQTLTTTTKKKKQFKTKLSLPTPTSFISVSCKSPTPTKRSKVFTIIGKSPILNVWWSSEYDYSIYNTTDFKGITPHILLKFYKFCRIVFHFSVNRFLFHPSIWLFPAYIFSWWISRGLQKKELLSFLKQKHNI